MCENEKKKIQLKFWTNGISTKKKRTISSHRFGLKPLSTQRITRAPANEPTLSTLLLNEKKTRYFFDAITFFLNNSRSSNRKWDGCGRIYVFFCFRHRFEIRVVLAFVESKIMSPSQNFLLFFPHFAFATIATAQNSCAPIPIRLHVNSLQKWNSFFFLFLLQFFFSFVSFLCSFIDEIRPTTVNSEWIDRFACNARTVVHHYTAPTRKSYFLPLFYRTNR